MRALVQRVSTASVCVDNKCVGEIASGLVVLICAMQGDGTAQADALAEKIAKLRIFRDDQGRMNKALLDIGGAALVVSQFTLAADTKRGNRPGYSAAAAPEIAGSLYDHFCTALSGLGVSVRTGKFGAEMAVSLVNDGPVTIWLDI